jgi:Leucine-rich repeat (LRR) protein
MLLRDDAQLAKLSGASKLESIGLLELRGNAQLASLQGLTALRSVALSASDLPALASLSALAGVELSSLELTNLPLLTDLGGLEAVSALWKLTLQDNDQLYDIAALGALESVEDTATLSDNPMLLNLHGLEGLRSVTAEITHNQTLEEVRALGGVEQGSLKLTDNAKLAQCEIDWLKAHAAVAIAAAGNGPAGSCP